MDDIEKERLITAMYKMTTDIFLEEVKKHRNKETNYEEYARNIPPAGLIDKIAKVIRNFEGDRNDRN
tara:strand:- start:1101 stop:1301 length:201 start_codon:yes stop_codon:yes gene_type:complete